MSLPNNENTDVESAIQQYGSSRILQEILKQYPDLQSEIFRLVNSVGVDKAVREILRSQMTPGPENIPGTISAPPTAATGVAPQTSPVNRQLPDQVSSAMLASQPEPRGVTRTGLAAREPQTIQPGGDIGLQRAMKSIPGDIEVPISKQIEPGRAAPAAQPEAPIAPQAPRAGMPVNPSLLETNPLLQMITGSSTPGTFRDAERIDNEIVRRRSDWARVSSDAQEISKLAAQHKVSLAMIIAMVRAESSYNKNSKSEKGALGLIQLMPPAARQMGLKVNTKVDERLDPRKNLHAGIKYLEWLRNTYKPKTVDEWLAAYNAGGTRLAISEETKKPAWKGISETRIYVDRVKAFMKTYADNPATMSKDLAKLMAQLQ